MTRAPRISFVAPIYQQAGFVARTVASVLGQSIGDLELIIVDDGSDDNAREVVEGFGDPRVRYVWQPNAGVSAATNAGVALCSGDYIALLGGDDVALPHRAKEQIAQIEAGWADIAFSLPEPIDEDDRPLRRDVIPVFYQERLIEGLSVNPVRTLFRDGNFLCAPSACAPRAVFETIGAFARGLLQLQDMDYWLRAARLGYRLRVSGEPGVQYRVRGGGGNLSGTHNLQRIEVELDYIMRHLLDGWPLTELRRWFGEDLPETGEASDDEAICRAWIYLSHPRRAVREIGYQLLIPAMDDPQAREKLAGWGMTPRILAELMLRD